MRELCRLFPPLSSARQQLRRAYAMLQRFEPAAPSYVYWHLARYVRTLGVLADVVRSGQRWLDISSDPWFCLLANKEIAARVELMSTNLEPTTITFRDDAGESYGFASQRLELCENDTSFAGAAGFDLVSALEVIEHLQYHPAPFLVACNNALRPGGKLLLTTPNVASWSTINRLFDGAKPHMTNQYGGPMDHRKEYTAWEMQRLVAAAGFRIDTLVTFDGYANDLQGGRTAVLWLGALMWHAVSLRPVRVRNHLLRGGSTMLVVATKIGEADSASVAAVRV